MLKLGVLVMAVVGACWVFGALLGGLFKLTFGLFGAVLGGLVSLLALGLVALLVFPIVLFVLLPMLLPVLCIVALVWFIVRAAHARSEPPRPVQG